MTRKTISLLLLILFSAGVSSLRAEVFYPWKKAYIGALEGSAWPGLVMALDQDSAFAFVLKVEKNGEIAEGGDFFYLASQVGPFSPDGQYARVRFDLGLPFKKGAETPILLKPAQKKQTLTIEWSRRDETTVVGRIVCPADIQVTIVHYVPWDFVGDYTLLPDGQVRGASARGRKPVYLFWAHRRVPPRRPARARWPCPIPRPATALSIL